MTKKTSLLNERVIRRWGKLANMPALTETFHLPMSLPDPVAQKKQPLKN